MVNYMSPPLIVYLSIFDFIFRVFVSKRSAYFELTLIRIYHEFI